MSADVGHRTAYIELRQRTRTLKVPYGIGHRTTDIELRQRTRTLNIECVSADVGHRTIFLYQKNTVVFVRLLGNLQSVTPLSSQLLGAFCGRRVRISMGDGGSGPYVNVVPHLLTAI